VLSSLALNGFLSLIRGVQGVELHDHHPAVMHLAKLFDRVSGFAREGDHHYAEVLPEWIGDAGVSAYVDSVEPRMPVSAAANLT
jgi:hypothetical protein